MNIQQIKGETEDGEVIDTDSLSKSERALNNVGIAIRETKNGVEDLRNPMTVLEDLATKWKDLKAIEKAPIIDALGGKYRANEHKMLISSYVLKCA